MEESWGIKEKLAKVVAWKVGKTGKTGVKRGERFSKILKSC